MVFKATSKINLTAALYILEPSIDAASINSITSSSIALAVKGINSLFFFTAKTESFKIDALLISK